MFSDPKLNSLLNEDQLAEYDKTCLASLTTCHGPEKSFEPIAFIANKETIDDGENKGDKQNMSFEKAFQKVKKKEEKGEVGSFSKPRN